MRSLSLRDDHFPLDTEHRVACGCIYISMMSLKWCVSPLENRHSDGSGWRHWCWVDCTTQGWWSLFSASSVCTQYFFIVVRIDLATISDLLERDCFRDRMDQISRSTENMIQLTVLSIDASSSFSEMPSLLQFNYRFRGPLILETISAWWVTFGWVLVLLLFEQTILFLRNFSHIWRENRIS